MSGILTLGEEVPAGIQYVAGELLGNRTALWVGKGPAGFAVLAGSRRVQDVPGGRLVGVSLTPAHLRKLYERIGELLEETTPKRVELPPEGIVLGDKPKAE